MRLRGFLIEQQKARANRRHFGEKKLDIINILVRDFAKMLSCHNKSIGSLLEMATKTATTSPKIIDLIG